MRKILCEFTYLHTRYNSSGIPVLEFKSIACDTYMFDRATEFHEACKELTTAGWKHYPGDGDVCVFIPPAAIIEIREPRKR